MLPDCHPLRSPFSHTCCSPHSTTPFQRTHYMVIGKMGFLNACVDMLLKLATLTPFNPFDEFAAQQPLFSSDITAQHPLQPSPGVDFHPVDASPGFQCHYPPNWVSCNTPTSRDCWIRDSNSAHGKFSQKDIHTDCKTSSGVLRPSS